jgi:putative copper export protein
MITSHILASSLWVGGCFFALFIFLPSIGSSKGKLSYANTVHRFTWIGMVVLSVQLLSGLYLATVRLPGMMNWFTFSHPYSHMIVTKLVLFVLSVMALWWIHVQSTRVEFPRDTGKSRLQWGILNILAVVLLITGVSFKFLPFS